MEIRTRHHIEQNRMLKRRFFISIVVLTLAASISAGVLGVKYKNELKKDIMLWAINNGHNVMRQDRGLLRACMNAPLDYIRSLFNINDIPKLVIDIKFKHFKKLREKRNEAIEKGFLIKGTDAFVPASIRMDGKTLRVKLRLKGDLVDHLQGNKWSYRIKIRGDERFMGMKTFSVQHPGTRSFQAQPLLFSVMRENGILTPRYSFVDVTVNGNNIGIMALEEHFTKELLESQQRRESVILKFDESLFWEEWMALKTKGRVFNNYKNTTIDSFESSRIAGSGILSRHYEVAVGLLRGFVNETLPASEVFDTELMGRFFAVSEFMGARHGVTWNNIRFYYNPITAKLEPIAFDSFRKILGSEAFNVISLEEPLALRLLKDPEIFAAYKDAVNEMIPEIADGTLQEKLKEKESGYLSILKKEFLFLQEFPYFRMNDQIKSISGILKKERIVTDVATTLHKKDFQPDYRYPAVIHAYLIKDSNGHYLEIANAVPETVRIKSIEWSSGTGGRALPFIPLSRVAYPVVLPPTRAGALPVPRRIYFKSFPVDGTYSLQINAAIEGSPYAYKIEARQYYAALEKSPLPVSTAAEQLAAHSFLTADMENKQLKVKQGRWPVKGSLIIPHGFTLTMPSSTTLRFAPAEGLISYGALDFQGTEDGPVLLDAISSKWQGIAVLDAGTTSRWSHVVINNTTGIERPMWELASGTTFYQSDIEMEHCSFSNNQTEDTLNIIRSKFNINGISIKNALSDGLDSDFSDGEINAGYFENIGRYGGDGVDLSGSSVIISDSQFRNISDKALSVGEGSSMTADNIIIDMAGTGAASKDGSTLNISNSIIKNSEYAGLITYVKKHAYGSANIHAGKMTFKNNTHPVLSQKGSSIILDGIAVENEDIDVRQLYRTIMKKGKTNES